MTSKSRFGAAILVVAVMGVALTFGLLGDGEESRPKPPDRDCVVVLGPTGLYCGKKELAPVDNDRLEAVDAEALRAIVDAQKDDLILQVRSEVPYGWFRHVLQQLRRLETDKFELRLETSVCEGVREEGVTTELPEWETTIQARSFSAEFAPVSVTNYEDGPDIVRIQPFGFAYDFGGTPPTPFESCDEEHLTFCEPQADPREVLFEIAQLRQSPQRMERDPLGAAEDHERKRVQISKFAREQYPFETMRGQLGNYWSGVRVEAFDEIPMTVVLETVDALDYPRRSDRESRAYDENLPNDLELRCQPPDQGSIDVLMLAFSYAHGVIIDEQK